MTCACGCAAAPRSSVSALTRKRVRGLTRSRYRTIGDATTDALTSALGSAGFSTDQVQQAVTAYTGIDQDTQDSIIGIATHGLHSAAQLAPIIAAGLLATGVGAPVAAVVAGLLPVVDDLLGLFAPKAKNCTFMVGTICITSPQPYGPLDPKWDTFASFASGLETLDAIQGSVFASNMDQTFPLYESVMKPEIAKLGTSALDQFKRAYYTAWKANEEFYINGYKAADPYALLTAVVKSWNAVHSPTPSATFAPGGTDGSYITRLLNGDVDHRRRAPITVNLGPTPPVKIAHVLTLHFTAAPSPVAAKAPTSASSGTAVAAVAVVGLGAAGVFYASRAGLLPAWARRIFG